MDKIFLGDANFFWGAERPDDLPPANLPEVAFAGRSNVGKSSLINAVLGRKTLVRTSQTPGQTRALNFFNIAERMALVDMPGYGYAKASKADMKVWQNLLKSYLRGRVTLRLACVLVDSRHGMKESDHEMLKLLDAAAVPTRVILTKVDAIAQKDVPVLLEKTVTAIKKHTACHPQPIVTSSHGAEGISELRAAIIETLGLN
jgi:GTP-binding protein